MRRLNRKQTLKVVKELDAFPKVPESYQETSSTGGTWIGADVVDISGEATNPFRNTLEEESVVFEMTPEQQLRKRTFQVIKAALTEEHALQDLCFRRVLTVNRPLVRRLQRVRGHPMPVDYMAVKRLIRLQATFMLLLVRAFHTLRATPT